MTAPVRQLLLDLEEAQQIMDGIAGRSLGEGRREIAAKAVRASEILSEVMDELDEYPDELESPGSSAWGRC